MKLKPTPIDEDTRRQVVSALRHAAWSGRDQVDELHGRGLLRTPKLEAHLRAEAMQFLVNEMRGWTPAEFLRRISKDLQDVTPAHMYDAILSWLAEHAEAARTAR